MSKLVRICSKAELPPEGQARELTVADRTLCIANLRGAITAMDNVCPHRGGPLGQGIIEDGKIVCPWHAWAFKLNTGICEHNPDAKVDVYSVHLAGDDVLIDL